MKCTPESVERLEPNQIFVFGSNLAGKHGAGAALLAAQRFGAKRGQGVGLMGQSYGIATKSYKFLPLPLSKISAQIDSFYKFAEARPDLEFLVTKIGCGLAGYTVDEVRKACFDGKAVPANVVLPTEFQNES